jgi:hypothetical protein
MRRNRVLSLVLGTAVAMGIMAGPASADHTFGVLDCDAAGAFDVEAASIEPLPRFEAPVSWSGLFLLDGTNRVFRAFSVRTPRWAIVLEATDRNPHATVACTLTSSGFNFETPWVLQRMLVP